MNQRFAGSVMVRTEGDLLVGYFVPPGMQEGGYVLGTMIVPPNEEHAQRFRELIVSIAKDLVEEASGKEVNVGAIGTPGGHA